ncbi:MAG TPA: AAA family ATPase [Candidatus Elarobacter sp.]|nr:AAA family ATPase [Candidatus Elarobacter sp.]
MVLGRERELSRIAGLLVRGRDVRRATVVRIAGEPGAGRSALLDEALRAARTDGWVALDARCYPGERRTPVAALRRLVGGALRGDGAVFDRYASGLRHDLDAADRGAGRFQSAFAGFLEGVLVDHPTVIAIDDAHWLDRQSFAALRTLLEPERGRCPTVIVTHRTGTDVPAMPGEAQLIVTLQPLTHDAGNQIVRAIWPSAPDDVATAIVERADGLPFALVSLAERAAAEGVTTPGEVAAGAHAVIRETLDGMPGDQRTFLQTCALIGDPVELRILRRLVDDEAELERLIIGCAHVVAQNGPVLRFKHAVISEAVLQSIGRPLMMRRRILAVLRAVDASGPADYDRIATLAADLGDADAEFDALFALGSQAVAEDAYEAAITAFERALAVRAPSDAQFVRFYNEYTIALRQTARWVEAHRVLEAAVEESIAKQLPSTGVLASSLLWAICVERDREAARVAYRDVRRRVADADDLEVVHAMGAYLAAEAADEQEFNAIRAAMPVLPPSSRYAATTLEIGTALLMSRLGRYPEATAAMAAARANGDVRRSVHRFSVDCYGSQVRFRQHGCAGARVQLGWLQVRDDGSIVSEAPPRMVLLYALELAAVVDLARGEWDAALAKIESAAPASLVFCAARTKLLAIAAAVAALGGDVSPYANAIDEDLRHCFQHALWHRAMPLVFWWAAYLHAHRPRDAAALVQPFRHLLEHRVDSTMMHFPIARVLYARRAGDRDLLRRLTKHDPDERAPWNEAQEILAAGAAFDALGDRRAAPMLQRAAAAFDALEAPFFSAYAAGIARSASAAQRELLRRLLRGEPERTRTAKAAAPHGREPTLREREIATLVAEGHTNRAIAERLTLSERTVEVHVANLFGKLNVSSRTQLARVVLERELAGHSA